MKRAEAENGSSFEAAMALGEQLRAPRHSKEGEARAKHRAEDDAAAMDGASSIPLPSLFPFIPPFLLSASSPQMLNFYD